MQLKDLVTEAIRLRRLEDEPRRAPVETGQEEDTLDDLEYQYPDDEPDFDFGDAVPPDGDEELDLDFGNNGDESGQLAGQLDQPLDTHNLNQTGLSGSSVSTPSGGSLNQELSDSGQAQDGVDPATEEGGEVDNLASTAMEDPNKQGVLRKVDGARLVYKRQTENGAYEELWQYNISKSNAPDSFKRRRAILAGTDIPPNKSTSPDGSQSYEVWTTTNAELVRIRGLQN